MRKLATILTLVISLFSCYDFNNEKASVAEIKMLQTEIDSLEEIITKNKSDMKHQMIRSLTFQDGNAENAMNFYVELFDNSKIISVQCWGENAPTDAGKIMQGRFELDGNLFMCSDSPAIHAWGFTPAVANYVECDDEAEINKLYTKLSKNGKVMMALENYGFSQKFAFVEDQFGVSWQLNLE